MSNIEWVTLFVKKKESDEEVDVDVDIDFDGWKCTTVCCIFRSRGSAEERMGKIDREREGWRWKLNDITQRQIE